MTDTITPGGLNSAFIAARLPAWVKHATGKDLKRLRNTQVDAQFTQAGSAAWFTQADENQQATLLERQETLRHAKRGLAGLLKHLSSITDFAEPLLTARLKADFGLEVDVNTAQVSTVTREWASNGRWQDVTVTSQSLLQAALQNFAANASFSADDCLSLDGKYTVKQEVIREPAILTFEQPLPITPYQFAVLCHSLDLGGLYQAHLSEVFDTPLTSSRVRYRSIEVNKALLRVHLSIARMKSEISSAGHDALLSLLDDHAALTYHGGPAKCFQLSMYGVPLNDAWVLSAEHKGSDGLKPVIVYLPGAPLYPLKEYPSVEAFKNDLRTSLRQPVYTELLLGYVTKAQQPEFARVLKDNLYHEVSDPFGILETVFNPDASLKLRSTSVQGNLFKALQDQHVVRLKGDARSLVVPSSEADAKASAARLAYWENLGLNVANVAAMLVPVLGEVMAAVMAEQLILEAIEGTQSWSNGDRVTAWAHLEALSINIAIAAGLAVAGVLKPTLDSSLVLDELVHVELPSGERRLWRPALEPYAKKDIKLANLTPDAKGIYAVGDKRYVRINKRTYEVYQEPGGDWRVDPGVDELYRPQLSSNGEGAWLAYGERPMNWSRQQLLRRLGHATDGLTDTQLGRAAEISGVSDDVLREVHSMQERMPPLLADTLRRMQLERQVTRLITAVGDGTARGRALGFLPELATELPHWPGKVIEVFEGPEPWGKSRVYGRDRWPDGRTIKLTKAELDDGKLPDILLADMTPAQADALLGESTPVADRLDVLRARLSTVVKEQRNRVFESLYESDRDTLDLGLQRIHKAFPSLPEKAARQIVMRATGTERQRLYAREGRVPLRMAEEARAYQRQTRITRAIEGLYEPNLSSLDSDTLALGLLPKVPGWTGRVRLELHIDTLSGKLAQAVGDSKGLLKRLVRSDAGYEAFDERGVGLGSSRSVLEATLKALPDSERVAIGYHITEGSRLGTTLRSVAAGDRENVARVLGITPHRPWFLPPRDLGDGRVGYPLGGAVSRSRSLESRVHDLYPRMNRVQRAAHLEALSRLPMPVEDVVSNLEREYETLRRTLKQWADFAVDNDLRLESGTRDIIRDRLLRAWRYEGGSELNLSELLVTSLPELEATFEHLRVLKMGGMNLEALPASFLGAFPNIQELRLPFNSLVEIPESIAGCRHLRELHLNNNDIATGEQVFAPLRGLRELKLLDLNGNALHTLSDAALQDLVGLESLRRLSLRENYLALSTGGLRRVASLPLWELDLSHNLIILDEAGAAAFALARDLRRLELNGNPLTRAPAMDRMTQLRHVDLSRCRIATWPQGLTVLMQREPLSLRFIELSHNAITSIPDLTASPFGLAVQRGEPLHLDLNGNPLPAEALQRLGQLGEVVHEEEEVYDPALIWLEGVSEAREQLWEALKQDLSFNPVFDALNPLTTSAEAQNDIAHVRERVWSVLEFAGDNQAFREELVEIARSFPVSCGDMGADAFSDFEIAQWVYRAAVVSGEVTTNKRDLFTLFTRLFRRSEVNRLADRITLRRVMRITALQEGTAVPALDPLDAISDAELLKPPLIDDIEIRLKLRLNLAKPLDYPESSAGMLFGRLAKVSRKVIDNVRDEVRAHEGDSAAREDWLVVQTSWRYYLKQHYKGRFDALNEVWGAGSVYLYECNEIPPLTITTLDKQVIDTLRPSLGDRIVNEQGVMQKVEMNTDDYTAALRALEKEQARATEQLIKDLTHAEAIN